MPRTREQLQQAAVDAEQWLDSLDPEDLASPDGHTWTQIATMLGTSRQAARPPRNATGSQPIARRWMVTGRSSLSLLALMPQRDNTCHTFDMNATIVLGKQGRLVIPAEVRVALGLAPGDQLHLHVAGSRLVLERPQDAVDQLRGLAKGVSKSRSLVDELLAERRLAAAAE